MVIAEATMMVLVTTRTEAAMAAMAGSIGGRHGNVDGGYVGISDDGGGDGGGGNGGDRAGRAPCGGYLAGQRTKQPCPTRGLCPSWRQNTVGLA